MVVTATVTAGVLDSLAVQALQARLSGSIIVPGDSAYDSARRISNLGFERYPALIVRAADAGDVARAVEFANAQGMQIAVRSGGHSIAGHSSVDNAVVIDLSAMNAVKIDQDTHTLWAQPGATSFDVFTAAEPHGLALSTGDTSSVGLGGLVTGGGIGWLVRKHGLTIDNLLSAEVVTADGRIVGTTATQNPDLFWAIRGGGGNFGIVTAFELQMHPDAQILGGALLMPPTLEVLRGFADYTPYAPEGLTTIGALMPAPPAPFVPEEVQGQLVFAILFAYAGDADAGYQALKPLRDLAQPLAELITPMPYSGMFAFTAEVAGPHNATVRSGYMQELSDEAIGKLLNFMTENPTPTALVQLRGLGGAMARVPRMDTAFAHRHKPLFLAVINLGAGDQDERWTKDLWELMRPYTSGVYVNFLEDEGPERILEAYPPATYARLARIKREYDPLNIFNLNQNIVPAS